MSRDGQGEYFEFVEQSAQSQGFGEPRSIARVLFVGEVDGQGLAIDLDRLLVIGPMQSRRIAVADTV